MPRYSTDTSRVSVDHLSGFFVGWPSPPSAHVLHEVLSSTPYTVVAWSGSEVIGFAYAVSDGVLAAYIPLVEVRTDRQGEGVGTELVRRLLSLLADVYMVDVVCDDAVAPFYERLGLSRVTGMAWRNRGASVFNAPCGARHAAPRRAR